VEDIVAYLYDFSADEWSELEWPSLFRESNKGQNLCGEVVDGTLIIVGEDRQSMQYDSLDRIWSAMPDM
jgi:hypothetical protein